MFSIVAGHIAGLLLPLLFFKNIKVIAHHSVGKAVTYILITGLIFFLEYQLHRSIKHGTIYFRGQVSAADGSKFTSCQFSYALLAGFLLAVTLQNFL